MSRWTYDEDCPDCRPAAIDMTTGERCGPDHPMTKAIDEVWNKAGPMTKAAFHRVTCLNSRELLDLALTRPFISEIQEKLDASASRIS